MRAAYSKSSPFQLSGNTAQNSSELAAVSSRRGNLLCNMKNIRSNDVITSQAAHIEAGYAATEWLSINIQE